MPYVTGAAILTHVGESSPSADDTAWAATCAAAIEAAITYRLDGTTPTSDQESELNRAALQDGAAAYNERTAPHGIQSIGPDGDIVRLGRDILRALNPVLTRIIGPGIG